MSHKWKGGGVWGSLRKRVAQEVNEHVRKNAALQEERYPYKTRALKNLLGNGSLFKLLFEYAVLVALIIILDRFVSHNWPEFLSVWKNGNSDTAETIKEIMKEATSGFMGAQATLIGLVFPVAIGLVTLLVQREGAASTNSDIKVYYHEALAYPVGVSSVALIIVLSAQTFWPSLCPFYLVQGETENLFYKAMLSLFHLSWFALNCVGLWHFLKTSLDFVYPSARAKLRKKFAANNVVPSEISKQLMVNLYLNVPSIVLGEQTDDDPDVMVGMGGGFSSKPEIVVHMKKSTLVDLRVRPFSWVLKNWMKRARNIKKDNSEKPNLIFPIELGKVVEGNTEICSVRGTVHLNKIEKFIIKKSFVFRRVK